MNKATLALLISGLMAGQTAMAMAPNTDLNLMPYPQEVELGKGQVALDKDFSIYVKGYDSERWAVYYTRLSLPKKKEVEKWGGAV
mgnify:CR=1 FL=1